MNSVIDSPQHIAHEVAPAQTSFSRANIAGDQQLEPYTLTGAKRVIFLLLYAGIGATAFGSFGYATLLHPVFGVLCLLLAYVADNLAFAVTHIRFHTCFVEVPEKKMNVLVHHAFIHHYRDIQVLHKTWLETRMSYFVDPKDVMLSTIFVSLVPGLIACLLYRVEPFLGLTYFSSLWIAQMLQSTVHEWYHNPAKSRRSFYSPPMYALFMLLEKLGIASTKAHTKHHRHRLHNLNEAEKWLDLYLPWSEALAERIWSMALPRYVPGKAEMTAFLEKVMYLTYIALHASLISSYLLMNHLLLR